MPPRGTTSTGVGWAASAGEGSRLRPAPETPDHRQPVALTVSWPGTPIVMVPPQVHWQVDPTVSTGRPLMRTFAEPGAHGPVGTGTQGIGVGTPRAADVAAITAGLAGEAHIPNIGMVAIGIMSAMVATNCPPAVTGG